MLRCNATDDCDDGTLVVSVHALHKRSNDSSIARTSYLQGHNACEFLRQSPIGYHGDRGGACHLGLEVVSSRPVFTSQARLRLLKDWSAR
jgi:hypothetical protein